MCKYLTFILQIFQWKDLHWTERYKRWTRSHCPPSSSPPGMSSSPPGQTTRRCSQPPPAPPPPPAPSPPSWWPAWSSYWPPLRPPARRDERNLTGFTLGASCPVPARPGPSPWRLRSEPITTRQYSVLHTVQATGWHRTRSSTFGFKAVLPHFKLSFNFWGHPVPCTLHPTEPTLKHLNVCLEKKIQAGANKRLMLVSQTDPS